MLKVYGLPFPLKEVSPLVFDNRCTLAICAPVLRQSVVRTALGKSHLINCGKDTVDICQLPQIVVSRCNGVWKAAFHVEDIVSCLDYVQGPYSKLRNRG